jgi:MFS family permease
MASLYASQGCWWPGLSMHLTSLGISSRSIGWIFSTLALSSILSPLIHGRLADRRWPAERILAFSFFMGAGLLLLISGYQGNNTLGLFCFFLVYWMLIAPGYGMVNAISMRHLASPREEFGRVRIWGTIGWMAGSYIVAGFLLMRSHSGKGLPEIFYVAVVLSILTAVQSLRLIPSPPMENTKGRFLKALRSDLLTQKDFVVYLILGFGVSTTTPFVFQLIPSMLERAGLSRPQVMGAMTLGQIPEILALWILPLTIRRIGYRGALFLGIISWVLRYGFIAAGAPVLWIILSMPLQGLAIGFFLVGGQVFVDEKAPRESRASLQALQIMICSGMGSFVGSLVAGECQTLWPDQPHFVFLVPCIVDVLLCFVLLIWFHPASIQKNIAT